MSNDKAAATWHPQRAFDYSPGDPALDPEVQALAKVIAAVIHPSYRQTDFVFHRKAINVAVAVLKAGYRITPANPADVHASDLGLPTGLP